MNYNYLLLKKQINVRPVKNSMLLMFFFIISFHLSSYAQNDKEANSFIYKIDSLNRIPSTNIFNTIELLPSVSYYDNEIVIRGVKQTNFLNINNIDVNDPVFGSIGVCDQIRYPGPSIMAYESVELNPANFSCSGFNNLGTELNLNLRKGNMQKFEVYAYYMGTIGGLYGSTDNSYSTKVVNSGIQLTETADSREYQSSGDRSMDIGMGGPLLFLDSSTFFISYRNYYRDYDAGFETYDPIGNNLGQLPNQRTFINNLTGTINLKLLSNLSLEINGMYGISSWENSSWTYLYATSTGDYDSALEREAKQAANNYKLSLINMKLISNITENLDLKFEIGYTNHYYETGRKASYSNPSFLDGFDIQKPQDKYGIAGGKLIPGANGIDDYYQYFSKIEKTDDGYLLIDRTIKNPLTGRYESNKDYSNLNPYGLIANFITEGNNDPFLAFLNSKKINAKLEMDYKYSLFNTNNLLMAGINFETYNYDKYINYTTRGNWLLVNSDTYDACIGNDSTIKNLYLHPFKPYYMGGFLQNNLNYKDFYIDFGFRLDYFDINHSYFDMENTSGNYNDFKIVNSNSKTKISPRMNIKYKITENQSISLGGGIFNQMPDFNYLINNIIIYTYRSSGIRSNPNLEPICNKKLQLSYSGIFFQDFVINTSIYRNWIENDISTIYVPAIPTQYSLYTSDANGNNYGFDLSLSKKFLDDFTLFLNYSYKFYESNGISVSDNLLTTDPYSGLPLPIYGSYRAYYDVPHKLNVILNYHLGNNEGLSIWGFKPFENLDLTLISKFQSGNAYTNYDESGRPISEINGARLPDNYFFDLRLSKKFYINNTSTNYTNNMYIAFSLDIFNLLNSSFKTINDLSFNGWKMRQLHYDANHFTSTILYKTADINNPNTFSTDQYDYLGRRLYNESIDFNSDGKVTQEEKFEGYTRYVNDYLNSYYEGTQLRSAFFNISIGF